MPEKILAIETSCDETAAAVVETTGLVLSNIIASQIDTHKDYGGVIPEIASRMHVEAINITIEKALADAKCTIQDISAIAVTYGPGLLGSLLIGLQAAKTLSFIHKLPLIGVNHMEGHIFGNFIKSPHPPSPSPIIGEGEGGRGVLEVRLPYLCLVVSGGHTMIVEATEAGYKTIGQTIDDAAGESYDKVARMLQLGYPGGPIIDKTAQLGDPNKIKFPKATYKDGGYNFSFSGLKTAVLNYYRKNPDTKKEDICAAFQKTVVDTLVEQTMRAAKEKNINRVYLAGGVAANKSLRENLKKAGEENNIQVSIPEFKYCTDNAAMIGGAAIPKYLKKDFANLSLNANPGLKL